METDTNAEFTGADKPTGFLIAGIGASAGGIQALKTFFQHVTADSGIAYVVILHLSPDHDSKLAEILQLVSAIPVAQVLENTEIKPDHVYVVPPNRHLVVKDGFISPTANMKPEDRRAPVDIFFRSLADAHGPRAICIVLSGTGANGSMGLKRIKERGGVAYVQSPREAEYNEMPRNSIATDLADEVLPVAEIPGRLLAYRKGLGSVEIIAEPDKRPEPQQQALREIFTMLRVRTGHDFSNYKRPTLLRRIERRINIRSLPDLPAYAAYLHEHPDESHALLKDLLISVTNFFRDKKAFEALERSVLPAIFAGKNSEQQVRIWVAGCATGEEAYSIAMLCTERIMDVIDAPKVQIFATDIDETAIATAREGLYTLNDAADVSPDRLRRFFNREGDGYRVRREIREIILFAHHNFLNDPPFSRLDLVSCRNVLIYLNNTAQQRVVETFHFALKPKGFLFLGSSESVDGAGDLYATENREKHIFRTREVSPRNYPVPESTPAFHFQKNDPLQKSEEKEERNHRISFGDLHQKLLEQYAPPSVVVNEEYEIVHTTEGACRYLEFPPGEPTQNLLKMVRPEIRLELRSALYQAVQHKIVVEARNIKLNISGQPQSLDIHIRPVLDEGDTAKGFILVIFKQSEDPSSESGAIMMASDEPVAQQLEEELIRLKAQLRSSIEQHEYQAEELKASNEELQAMNEELRSAAEELETGKEELQSINEELRTVNQELKVKIDEISLVSNNLQNLINSADVGTIFLDRNFCIRLFTPAVLDIFNLKSTDYGRPITDITHKLQYTELVHDAEMVLEKLTVVEREVPTLDDRFFMMRLLPYRTSEDRINGVVITFFDITVRTQAENILVENAVFLEQQVSERTGQIKNNLAVLQQAEHLAQTGSWEYLFETGAFTWSEGMYRLFGLAPGTDVLPKIYVQKAVEEDKTLAAQLAHNIREGILPLPGLICIHADDQTRILKIEATIIKDEHGKPLRMNGVDMDITTATNSAKTLLEQAHFIKSTNEALPDILFVLDLATHEIIYINHSYAGGIGLTKEINEIGKNILDIIYEDDVALMKQHLKQMKQAADGEVLEIEYRVKAADGSLRWFRDRNAVFRRDKRGKPVEKIGIAQDITERKNAEQELRENNIALQYANENSQQFASIASHDLQEPLRKLQLFSSVLQRYKADLPEEATHAIAKIRTTSERMSRLIREVLQFSKIAYGAKDFGMTDLQLILNDVLGDLDLLISDTNTTIETEEDLPVIEASSIQMNQLFYNLLTNAIKFRRANLPGVIHISVQPVKTTVKQNKYLKEDRAYIEIIVADNGIGFEKQYAEQIFQIFERLHTVDEFEGTGLGLALCKKIIENHSGHIYAESKEGAGASFHIFLPVKQ